MRSRIETTAHNVVVGEAVKLTEPQTVLIDGDQAVLTTTLHRLRRYRACADRYKRLVTALGPKWGADVPINLLTILKHNGPDDCLWAFKTTQQNCDRQARLIAVDFAEYVLPIFEAERPVDLRPAVEVARKFARDEVTDGDLTAAWAAAEVARDAADVDTFGDVAWDAARDVAKDGARDAAWFVVGDAVEAAAGPNAWAAVRDAAGAVAEAVAADAAWVAAGAAVRDAAGDAARDVAKTAAGDAARDVAWVVITKIIRRYLLLPNGRR